MSDIQEYISKDTENLEEWAEFYKMQEILSNETEYTLQETQIQIETQQNVERLKQKINKENFNNYMSMKWTPVESQSPEVQYLAQNILRPAEETELTRKQKRYKEIKTQLIEAIKKANILKIVFLVTRLFKEFLGLSERTINVSKDLNYEPNEGDKNFFINAITATLDPEKRSRLAYFLWKIKDKENKEILKEKWIDKPSQFQLFLQNCKPWQLILTNGKSIQSNWDEMFFKANQIVSWARWCHSAVISDIIKENWVIIDAKIIQASWTWIQEISLKKYLQENYAYSDLLLWTFQPPEKWNDIVNRCKKYVWNDYSNINLLSSIVFDNSYWDENEFNKQEKNKYCSDFVFTVMGETWLELPDPHTMPADLLWTSSINPEYCSYCDNFL